jgi:hypothetical protein
VGNAAPRLWPAPGRKERKETGEAKGIGTGWDGNRELESSWRLRVRWDKLSRPRPRPRPRPRHLVAVRRGWKARHTTCSVFPEWNW